MNKPMTLEQMLETGRPAYSQDLFYRFVPRKGFAVASFVRFSPAWLPCSIPSGEVQLVSTTRRATATSAIRRRHCRTQDEGVRGGLA